jgi:endo-1,4-beta-xylanase
MEFRQQSRRQFLYQSATAAAMAAMLGCRPTHRSPSRPSPTTGPTTYGTEQSLGMEESLASTDTSGPTLRVAWQEADGSPISSDSVKLFHGRDMSNDPLPQGIRADGKGAMVTVASEPIQLVGRLKIPNFGEVYCFADNGGDGYSRPGQINFVVEAAETRSRRVLEAIYAAVKQGVSVPDACKARMFDAVEYLDANDPYASLANSMPAGEMLALAVARHRISKFPAPRKEFLFGTAINLADQNPLYNQRVDQLFNFAPCSWFTWKDPYVPENPVDYTRMDRSIDWAIAHKIIPKSYGYTYMARGATPVWLRPTEEQIKEARSSTTHGAVFPPDWNFEKLLDLYKRVNEQTLARYKDRLPYVEVINEAHDKANLWRLNQEQILTITRESLLAARRGSPTVRRQINDCCLWAEYAKTRNLDGSRRWSPFRYLSDCINHGCEFEVIGLQLYYPQYDLFEIDRMLDRFKVFNKPIHITELATASVDGQDKASMRPNSAAPGWHGPWSESTQADWVEGIYTICYSRKEFEAVSWWDLADVPGKFWPFGGMLHGDFTPKESYLRLAKLQKDWGVAKG